MENGGRQISNVTLYACGTCKNNVASVFKGEKKREVIFPALVAKFEHVRYGTILFDTGYSKRVFENGIVSKLYNLLNPTSVSEEETITYKMKAEGCTVSNIILSHPHPDHIGCLKDFSNYTLIATGDCIDELKRAKTFELVLSLLILSLRQLKLLRMLMMQRKCSLNISWKSTISSTTEASTE